MMHSMKYRIGTALLAIAVLAVPASAGQKTIPQWNSWPGTIWGAGPSGGDDEQAVSEVAASSGLPVLCDLKGQADQAHTVQLVAQSAGDCNDVGGRISDPAQERSGT